MMKIDDKTLMNLPIDIKNLLATGRSSLYRLPKKYSNQGAYLLAISRDSTFFISEDGKIGNKAGKLDDIEVIELLRFSSSTAGQSAQFKLA